MINYFLIGTSLFIDIFAEGCRSCKRASQIEYYIGIFAVAYWLRKLKVRSSLETLKNMEMLTNEISFSIILNYYFAIICHI